MTSRNGLTPDTPTPPREEPAPPAPPERKPRNGFAVAGLGKMGIMHAAMLGVVPGGAVAALVDQDPKLCDTVRSMGVEAPGFTSLEACLDQVRPEGVWIATPQFAHRALFEECLARRIAVFCEKPLAHTLEDARAMAELAGLHPEVPVAIGYQMLHNALLRKAAELIEGGVLGKLKSFRASCRLSQVFSPKQGWTFTRERAGGGVAINSGVHVLSMLARLFGRPAGVTARGCGVHNEVEDTLAALLDYPSGLWGSLEVTWSVPGYELQTNDVEVIGTAGTLEVGNQWLRLWLYARGERYPAGWTQWARGDLEPRAAFSLSPDYCGDEFYLEDKDFVEAVRGGRKPKVGIEMALLVQEILDALYRSMAERRQGVAPGTGAPRTAEIPPAPPAAPPAAKAPAPPPQTPPLPKAPAENPKAPAAPAPPQGKQTEKQGEAPAATTPQAGLPNTKTQAVNPQPEIPKEDE